MTIKCIVSSSPDEPPPKVKEAPTKVEAVARRARVFYPDGDKYRGEMLEGKKHGNGVYTMVNGTTLKGRWKNDLKMGDFIVTTVHSGSLFFTARYINDELVPDSVHFPGCSHDRAKRKTLENWVTTTVVIDGSHP